ncbi:MAG: phosphatidate cytidylyltransferase [Synergistaceae bacterium]|nr:phosphatidate cytidylyltransferase [Synergistaceae bacterium]
MENKKSDLPLRIVGSIFVVTAVLGGIWFGNPLWAVICSAASLASLQEFYKLTAKDHKYSPILMFLFAGAVLYAIVFKRESGRFLVFASIFVILVLFDEVWDRQRSGNSMALRSTGNFIGGVAYAVLPWCYLALLRDTENGKALLTVLFFCTWACDVFAYFTGRRFGKHKLCDKVSPKKTWEGSFGGAAACMLCAFAGALLFKLPLLHMTALGLFCGVLGQAGDLAESVLKREAGVKDSGNIIPGHGGMLDRFDSMLVNAVIAYIIFGLFVR